MSAKFPEGFESFQVVWKLSRMSEKFSDCPDSSFIFQRVSVLCGMFLYHLESVLSFRQVLSSKFKTFRHRKLKSSHHVDLIRSTWCELFSFLGLIVLDLKHFKILGGLVFLFTLYISYICMQKSALRKFFNFSEGGSVGLGAPLISPSHGYFIGVQNMLKIFGVRGVLCMWQVVFASCHRLKSKKNNNKKKGAWWSWLILGCWPWQNQVRQREASTRTKTRRGRHRL